MSELPTYAFTVQTLCPANMLETKSGALRASYFQEQGAYTLFKDTSHTVVEAFRTELVTRIVRTDEPVA